MKFKSPKKVLSLLMSLVLIVSTFALPVVAKAATVSPTSGMLAGSGASGRANGDKYNIINDGSNNKTTAAFWNYSLSDYSSSKNLDSASVTFTASDWSVASISGLGINFYYINPSLASSYVKSTPGNITNEDLQPNNTTDRHAYLVSKFGLTDDNKLGTLEHNYSNQSTITFTDTLKEAIKESYSNGWSSVCIIAIVNQNRTSNTGGWSDTWIQSGSMSFEQSDYSYTITDLKNAITAYENAVKGGAVKTNMKAAYDAYVAANKVYDAYYYGQNTSVNIAAVCAKLIEATNEMTAWTAYTGTAHGTFSGEGDSYATDENYAKFWKNVLYSTSANEVGSATVKLGSNWLGSNSETSRFYYPETVMMYDGTTDPQMGILYHSNPTKSGTWSKDSRVRCAYLDSNYGGLAFVNSTWNGTATSANFINIINQGFTSVKSSNDDSSTTNLSADNTFFANLLSFNVSNDSFESGSYVKSYKPTFKTRQSNSDNKIKENTITSNTTIYVFNYRAVVDKIKSISLPDFRNYKQGGLSTALATLDKLTADPNSFFTSGNNISDCESNYKSAINSISSDLSSASTDAVQYQNLRNAIDNATNESTDYTASSLIAYGQAIKNARDIFALVPNLGYDRASDAQTKTNELNTAKNALVNAYGDSNEQSFNAAVKVVEAMDKNSLKDASYLETLISSSKAQLKTTLSDTDKTYYQLATGETVDSAKNISGTELDDLTKALLEYASNKDNIKDVTVEFGAQVNDKDSYSADAETVKYGELVKLSLDNIPGFTYDDTKMSVKWEVAPENGNSYYVSTNENYIEIKATDKVQVTAYVVDTAAELSDYAVKLYNLYGNVYDIVYTKTEPTVGTVDSVVINNKPYPVDAPFYTVNNYTISKQSDKVYIVKPNYQPESTVEVNVLGGNADSKYLDDNGTTVTIDRPVTISYTGADTFVAWAVKTDNGYQIASYSKEYTFKTYTNETYVPVIDDNGTYKVYSDSHGTVTQLTASMIDEVGLDTNASNYNMTPDAYLKAKLDKRTPFVSVQTAKIVDGSKYRMYIRVTEGSDANISAFGVAKNGKMIAVKNRNTTTGQLSVTFSSEQTGVQAYVTYNFDYTFNGNNYNIVATDYASIH